MSKPSKHLLRLPLEKRAETNFVLRAVKGSVMGDARKLFK